MPANPRHPAADGTNPAAGFAAGERWTYRAPAGFEASRLVIGAILRFEDSPPVVCVSITSAPHRHPDGAVVSGPIAFLPLSEAALARTVLARDGCGEPPPDFSRSFDAWHGDGRGLSYFTVPFEGYLDRMVALQMAEIIAERDAAGGTPPGNRE